MNESILTTNIFHAPQTVAAQTGDYTWIIVLALLMATTITLSIIFKKKFARVCLSLVLVAGLIVTWPAKSFGAQSLTITATANIEVDQPAEITITNNEPYATSIKGFEIINNELPTETTWNVSLDKDDYQIFDTLACNNISFDIQANSSCTIYAYPNTEDLPCGNLCDINFNTVSSHYTTDFINSEDNVKSRNNFDFSFQKLANADSTQFNREIASMQAAFASIPNTYNNLILDGLSYPVSDRLSFMRNLGFEDNLYCKLWPDKHLDVQADPGVIVDMPNYTKDINDVTSFCFNHKKINFGSHETEFINISVAGTGGDFEWASNFDFGAETEDYANATGNHPEWINKQNHKGFDIATNRLLYVYNSYYSNFVDNNPNVDKIILVNGHSRGGAVANLVGKHFENLSLDNDTNENIKTFVYTFASPNTASTTLNAAKTSIFNIMNMDDLVSQFPGYISGFYKYGKDIPLSVFKGNDVNGTPLKTIFEQKSGYGEYNGNDPENVAALIAATCDIIEGRDEAYTLNCASSQEYTKLGSYETNAEAQADLTEFQRHLNEYNLNNEYNLKYYAGNLHVEYRELTEDYVIKFTCCAAFIMQDISNWVFIYKGDESEYQPSIGYNETLIDVLLQAIGVVPGIQHSHIWMSYNILAQDANI